MLEGKVTYVNHDCFAPLSNLCRSRSHFYNERPSKIRYGYNNVKYGSGSGSGFGQKGQIRRLRLRLRLRLRTTLVITIMC